MRSAVLQAAKVSVALFDQGKQARIDSRYALHEKTLGAYLAFLSDVKSG